ncbi:MAG: hypothetical protein ACRCYS_06950 [Beijerinckiaceae bacterium]
MYLVRWLHKILSIRFTQAGPNKSYNIKLSTLIENSGIGLYARMSDNLKYVEQALNAMTDVIARYTIERDFGVHRETGKGRVLLDAKIIIWPTHAFCIEQIKSNVHQNRLDKAVLGETGQIVLEPERSQFRSLQDYERAKAAYLGGRKLE